MKKQKLLVGIVILGMGFAAHAASITGGISFDGDFEPQDAGGVEEDNLLLASQIAFDTDGANPGADGIGVTEVTSTSGDFTVVPLNSVVTMFTPLDVNPTVVPGSALWTVGGFSFSLTTLVEDFNNAAVLVLSGVGTISSVGFDDTEGTWTATFNGGGGTFSWSSSTSAAVPEGGMTVGLLGIALTGLALIRRKINI